jgi:DNA-binding IclR family transcriptional regulator
MLDQPTVERAVLGLVLDAHPKSLTIPDLAREIGPRDAVERAVSALVGVGLLERRGVSIRLTRAAIHFDRLDLP